MITDMPSNSETVSIVLPTQTCLSGACLWEDGIAAVDGYAPYVYLFDESGCFKAAVKARRAYKSISSNDGENFVCCGCSCDKNVYFLNCRFEETGAMTPENSSSRTVSASFYTVSPYDNCVAVTFDKSVKLYRKNGGYVSTLKEESDGTYYLCYQSFPEGDCTAYEKDSGGRIAVNDNVTGNGYVLSTGSCVTPRSLIMKPCGDIWSVIGYRFLYNDLIPVFTDGNLNCMCSSGF